VTISLRSPLYSAVAEGETLREIVFDDVRECKRERESENVCVGGRKRKREKVCVYVRKRVREK
jgi:hypothetical protein